FDAATLPAVQALERYVFELGLMPQAALCDDRPPPPVASPSGQISHLLVTPGGSGVALTAIDADLHRVLARLETPIARKDAAARPRRRGRRPRAVAPRGRSPGRGLAGGRRAHRHADSVISSRSW